LDVLHQRERPVDQVVIVEQAGTVLLGPVTADHRIRDGENGRGAVTGGSGTAAPVELDDSIAFGAKPARQIRVTELERTSEDASARLVTGCQKDRPIGLAARFVR